MQVTTENFISARYIDNEKKIVEILYRDGDNIIPHIIKHNTKHPDWQKLMTITSLDEIHLNTHNHIKQSQKDFKKLVMKIAEDTGLLKTKTNTVTKEIEIEIDKPISSMLDTIFVDTFKYDDEKYKEEIFKTKLKAFEYDFIKMSKNRDLKSKLRKSETYLDIVCIVCEFVKENNNV